MMFDEPSIICVILNELHNYDQLVHISSVGEGEKPQNEQQGRDSLIYGLAQELIKSYDLIQTDFEPIKLSIRRLLASKLSEVNIIPAMPEVINEIQLTLIGSQEGTRLPADIWLLRCVYSTLLLTRLLNESLVISHTAFETITENLIFNAKLALLIDSKGDRLKLKVYMQTLPFLNIKAQCRRP